MWLLVGSQGRTATVLWACFCMCAIGLSLAVFLGSFERFLEGISGLALGWEVGSESSTPAEGKEGTLGTRLLY